MLLFLLIALFLINSANDAVFQLRIGIAAVISNVDSACKGKMRHALKDEPCVVQELVRFAAIGLVEVKKAVLDAHCCLTPVKWVSIMTPRLSESAVAAYAAEVSVRVADPIVVLSLFDRLAERKVDCMKPELVESELEICVWLMYAFGASISGADQALRERAAKAAVEMLVSSHFKVCEVAVETIASVVIQSYAKDIADLIAKEKAGVFAQKNNAALLI